MRDNHQLESRMRETRLSGSEGGAGSIPVPTPISPKTKGRWHDARVYHVLNRQNFRAESHLANGS